MFKRKAREQPEERRQSRGGNAAPVFSYRSSRLRTDMPTGRHQEKAVKQHDYGFLINIPTYIALALIVGSVAYATTLSTQPKIQVFNAPQAELLRDKAMYADAAQKLLASSLINRLKFTLDTDHVSTELKKQFPELGVVNISIPLIDRHPIVQVTLATTRLLLNTDQGTFVISDAGYVLIDVAEAPTVSSLNLPTVKDETGLQVKQGDRAFTPKTVSFIVTVSAELEAKGYKVESLTLPPVPEELDVKLQGEAYTIKFNFLDDARQQTGSYLALKEQLNKERKVPAEYIDLRVEEHAYYR